MAGSALVAADIHYQTVGTYNECINRWTMAAMAQSSRPFYRRQHVFGRQRLWLVVHKTVAGTVERSTLIGRQHNDQRSDVDSFGSKFTTWQQRRRRIVWADDGSDGSACSTRRRRAVERATAAMARRVQPDGDCVGSAGRDCINVRSWRYYYRPAR